MNKSTTFRNFSGGFLGGTLGILLSSYISPEMLPIGVFIGVIFGWWQGEIIKIFFMSFQLAQQNWQPTMFRLNPKRKYFIRNLIQNCTTVLKNGTMKTFLFVIRPFMWIKSGCDSIYLYIDKFTKWKIHPASKASLIIICAAITGIVISGASLYTLFTYMGENKSEFGLTELDIIPATAFSTLFAGMFGLFAYSKYLEDEEPMRNFYNRWENYSKSSPFVYFVKELLRFFKSQVILSVNVISMLIYWITLGGAVLAIIVIPTATFMIFMIGLYRVALQSAHWWCVGITLTVTALSAFIFYDNFNNEMFLWVTALCTGTISGLVTEMLCRVGVWWSNTKTGKKYLEIWYDEDKIFPASIARPVWKKLAKVFNIGFTKLTQIAFA